MKKIVIFLCSFYCFLWIYSQNDLLYHSSETKISLKDPYISLDDSPTSKLIIFYRASFDSLSFQMESFKSNEIVIMHVYKWDSSKKERKEISLPSETMEKIRSILCNRYFYVESFGKYQPLHPKLICVINYNPKFYLIEDLE